MFVCVCFGMFKSNCYVTECWKNDKMECFLNVQITKKTKILRTNIFKT